MEELIKPTEQPTTKPVEETTKPSQKLDSDEVEALKKIIKEQRAKGATVSEDINNADEYTWENGRLTKISWYAKGLTGSIDFLNFKNLSYLDCLENELSSLDVSNNTKLEELYYNNNQITNLDLTNNTNLEELNCDDKVEVVGYDRLNNNGFEH